MNTIHAVHLIPELERLLTPAEREHRKGTPL